MPLYSSTTSSNDLPFRVSDGRKRGYFTVDNVLLDIYGAQLGPYGIAVYCALCRFANADQECWPSFETIARRTGMSRRQAIREIGKIVQLGLISVTPQGIDGKHTSNLYLLLDIVEHGDTQSPLHGVTQSPRSVRQSPRTIPKKNRYQSEEERKKSYIPAEYRDIIIG